MGMSECPAYNISLTCYGPSYRQAETGREYYFACEM